MHIPLKVTTDYTLLKSLIKMPDLISFLCDNKINACGICDENLYGVLDFYFSCKKNNIKPIIGLSIKLNNLEVCLYAINYEGYKNLLKIHTLKEKNELNVLNIKEFCKNILVILPYESKELYNEFSCFDVIFIGYKTQYEKINALAITKNIVFFKDLKVLKKEEVSYLKYLDILRKDNIEVNSDCCCCDDVSDENIEKIVNLINIEIPLDKRYIPKYSDNSYELLKNLCVKGLNKRLNGKVSKEYVDRLKYELDVINKMGFVDYFLIVYDYVLYAKKNNILVGPGRGSAAGSLVSYSIGITEIDPISFGLMFERFLNPERVTMPDIDMDFDASRRDEVIKYVENKYGNKRVAQILTFSTLKAKQVLRDISRIFDLPSQKTDDFIKLIDSNLSLSENKKSDLVKDRLEKDTLLTRIYDIASHLENLKRQTSIHAAGVIISRENLDRYIPLYKISDDEFITGYDMTYLEELGLLKMDFLSITNLSLISELLSEIKSVNFSKIPLDDKKTIELFKSVDTDGIFQFESTGMKNVLRKFNVESFDDLAVIIALFRPGPMENIDSYIRRKEGKEKVTYLTDDLKPILESTYGIIIYQEQIMQIASVMAGYTLGEADILRRAMSKKKHEIMDSEREKFISRSINKGYSEEVSNKVFDLIYKFADYGFNKSHSVGYATVSFKMAYLKAHYRIYFMKHLLTMVSGNDVKTRQYINECKNNNIELLMPSINDSDYDYKIENSKLRFPLTGIKNIGHLVCREIIEERKNGEYISFFDFIKRCYGKSVNKKTIESLVNAGAFDIFNYNHKTLIESIDIGINYAELVKDLGEEVVNVPELDITEEYDSSELIKREYDSFGFYLSYHPVQNYRRNNFTTMDIRNNFNKIINIYLLIDNVRTIVTKKGEKMAFITGSDEYGEIDMVMFPRTYEKYYNLSKGEVVLISAKVEKRINQYQLVINSIQRF